MPRRRTLPRDEDPLSLVITPEDRPSPPAPQKVRVAFHLPRDLAEAARNCVYHLSGPPLRLTMAELAERALQAEITRLEQEHHQGEPFPQRQAELKGGRPIR
ncbi:MAG: hypothetical protein ACE5HB_01570 [Terriglobia bacterium]